MQQQVILFFTALQFYTRIPVPGWVQYKTENLSLATRFFPVVGWLVGLIAGLVWLSVSFLTDTSIGLLISMIVSIFTTGAFHEDGLADVCDGFGGGWTREKILEIMKDSRIGTYGSAGLIFILGLKFYLLQYLAILVSSESYTLILILVSAHAISRFMAALVIFTQPYARDTEDSKAKPVAQVTDSVTIIFAGLFAVIPIIVLAFYNNQAQLFLPVVPLLLITILMARYFNKWIGGYTGDCLGTIQQVCEIGFYFFLAVIWKFI